MAGRLAARDPSLPNPRESRKSLRMEMILKDSKAAQGVAKIPVSQKVENHIKQAIQDPVINRKRSASTWRAGTPFAKA